MNLVKTVLILIAGLSFGAGMVRADEKAADAKNFRVRGKAGYTFVSDHGNFGPYGLVVANFPCLSGCVG